VYSIVLPLQAATSAGDFHRVKAGQEIELTPAKVLDPRFRIGALGVDPAADL
jgi:hypothetical protein